MEAARKWLTQQENRQLLYLLVCGLLLRGAIAFWLPPGFDEGYYYLYTLHPDWSYFDHPLLVALTTGFGVWLTGDVSAFTIRLGALLLHTGSLLLLYLTAVRLFSKHAAIVTLAIASLIPIFQLGFGVLTLPDSPLMFFWTATMYMAVCEFFDTKEDGEPQRRGDAEGFLTCPYHPTYRLAIVGLLVGLACLGKYHGLALGFGLIGFCLTSPRHRVALVSPWTLASLGLFTLAVLPIVLWNVQYDWVSLRFQSGRAVPDRGYSLLDLFVTFLAGVAYLFPTFGFPLWWVSGKAVVEHFWGQGTAETQRRGERAEGQSSDRVEGSKQRSSTLTSTQLLTQNSSLKTLLVLWLSLPLMLVFTLMGGYRAILPTWAMPGFWGATLLLGQQAASWPRRTIKRWLWGSGLVIASLLLVALLHVTIGTLQKPSRYALFGGFLTPSNDASTQLIDIHQLRQGFADTPLLMTAMQTTDFLFTNDLYLAGQLGMAIAPLNPKPITCFDKDLRGFAFWSTHDQWVGQDGLLITSTAQASLAIKQYQEYFQEIQKVAEIPIQRGGAIVQVIEIYQCKTLLKPYPRPYGK